MTEPKQGYLKPKIPRQGNYHDSLIKVEIRVARAQWSQFIRKMLKLDAIIEQN